MEKRDSTANPRDRKTLYSLPSLAALVTAVGVTACGSSSITNPAFQPEIANTTDSFQLQATGVNDVTQTLTYAWQNTGTLANVDQSGAISSGTAILTILDAQGRQVYSGELASTGSYTSGPGQAGAWTIEITLSGVSGTLNVRVQKG